MSAHYALNKLICHTLIGLIYRIRKVIDLDLQKLGIHTAAQAGGTARGKGERKNKGKLLI